MINDMTHRVEMMEGETPEEAIARLVTEAFDELVSKPSDDAIADALLADGAPAGTA